MVFRLYKPLSGVLNFFRSNPLFFSLSNLFKLNLPRFDYKKTDKKPVSKFLYQGFHCYIGIKDFLLKQISLYKYIWKDIIYRVITSNRYLCLDIWSKTPNQNTNTKDMILTIL